MQDARQRRAGIAGELLGGKTLRLGIAAHALGDEAIGDDLAESRARAGARSDAA